MPAGRPPKIPPEELAQKLDEYMESTDVPIVAEFAYLMGYNRTSIYEIPEISDGLRALVTKKEFALERLGLSTNSTAQQRMAEMSLKQIGWSEKQDVNLTGGVVLTKIEDDIPKPNPKG